MPIVYDDDDDDDASDRLIDIEDVLLLVAIVLLPWAFGGVEPWAFHGAALLIALAGAVALVRNGWSGWGLGAKKGLWLTPALLLLAWAGMQLVPLPAALLETLSPRAHAIYGEALIANVAPMMGLLGTVMGMVAAFNEIAASKGQANPADLASGISQALLTTMLGLIVAIPVTAAFAFLRNRLIKTIIETGAIVEDLFERFRPTS